MQNSAHHPRALTAESALGITDPPELQRLRRRRFAAQPHHGSTADQECCREGTDLDWTPHSRLPVPAFHHPSALGTRAPLPHWAAQCQTRLHSARETVQSRSSVTSPPPATPGARAHSPCPASDASRCSPPKEPATRTEAQEQLSSLRLPGTQIWRQGCHRPLSVPLIG